MKQRMQDQHYAERQHMQLTIYGFTLLSDTGIVSDDINPCFTTILGTHGHKSAFKQAQR